MEEVSSVRQYIDHIDEELVRLLKTRYELAKQLGTIKRAQGLEIRDPYRERSILRKVQKMATANSLPTRPTRRIFLELFNLGLDAQRPRNTSRDLQGLEVLIAGGTGGMGRLLARILASHRASVRIFGRRDSRSRKAARELGVLPGNSSDAKNADVVFVSVPINATVELSLKLGSMMRPDSLLADLSSVKTGIADTIAARTGRFEYVSLHPLFGPDLAHIGMQKMVAVQYRVGSLWRKMRDVFRHEGVRILVTNAREHDVMMAHVQALQHFALICLGVTVGRPVGKFATRSFGATEDQMRRLVQNWDTILGIQRLNPFAARERENFRSTVNRMVAMNPTDSKKAFRALAKHVQKWSRKR